MESETSQTGTTLFAILDQPADSQAWSKFVDRYAPLVFRWCRSRGLQPADAEDVTQEVLGKFAKAAQKFSYDRAKAGFRAWLRTVTKHALADLATDRRSCPTQRAAAPGMLEGLADSTDLQHELEAALRREMLDVAMNRVRLRVEPNTWRAFELLALERKSGQEVARQLNLSIAAAYMAKSRVQRLLTEEARQLEQPS